MAIVFGIYGFVVSVVFFVYKFMQIYNLPETERSLEVKQATKDSFFIFILTSTATYLVSEYFYKDFLKHILETPNKKTSTDVFTDKPGF